MVNRRTFIQQAGLVASAAVAFPAWQAPRRYKIGLQLFTLNAAMNRDPLGTLKRVAAMGYEEVETYGINPDALTYYGMPAGDFAKALRDHNLPTPTGHYDFQNLLTAGDDAMNRYVDRVTEGAKLLGQQYVVWPYLEPATRTLDTYKRVAERLNVIGARVSKAGLRVAYHNGGGEFVPQNGQYPYDAGLLVLNRSRPPNPLRRRLTRNVYHCNFDTRGPEMPIHVEVLGAAQRLCAGREKPEFTPDEIVRALPNLNAQTVRTHVTSRCCVNATPHHQSRYEYFRKTARGRYELMPKHRTPTSRTLPGRNRPAPQLPAVQDDTIHAVVTRSDGAYSAACHEIAVVTQGRTLDETLANLKEAIALHLDGEDLASFGLSAVRRIQVTYELPAAIDAA